MWHKSNIGETYSVYFPLTPYQAGFSSEWNFSFSPVYCWICDNIKNKTFQFQESNMGVYYSEEFDRNVHNCIKITFQNEIDKNYFVLIWGDRLK